MGTAEAGSLVVIAGVIITAVPPHLVQAQVEVSVAAAQFFVPMFAGVRRTQLREGMKNPGRILAAEGLLLYT